MNTLEKRRLLENTIVVFTADHGDFAGDHGLVFKGCWIYESIHRIPFLIRYPRAIPRNVVCNEIIESIDLFPTLCDLCGVPVPESVQGKSIRACFDPSTSWTKDYSVCEWFKIRAIRTRHFRMVYDTDEKECQLYDHRDDPGEMINRYNDTKYARIQANLMRQLMRFYLPEIARFPDEKYMKRRQQNLPTPALWRGESWQSVLKRFPNLKKYI